MQLSNADLKLMEQVLGVMIRRGRRDADIAHAHCLRERVRGELLSRGVQP
jgi:hypothetical protein